MANIPFLNNAYFSSRVGIGVTPSYDLDVAGTLGVGGLPFDNTSTSVLVQDQTLAADTVINGDFDTDTNWNKGTAWTINNGTSNISGAQTAVSYMSQSSVLTSPHNKTYLVTYTISNITAGDIRINLGGYNTGVIRTSNGTYTEEIIPTNPSANHLLYVQASIDAICDFDNISCQEVTSSSDQIQKRQLGEAAFTDGPFLPLTGGTLSGDLYLNDGVGASPSMYFKNQANNYWRLNTETDNSFSIKQGTTLKGGWTSSLLSLNTSLTLGSNAVQKDLKVYGNLAGEYMLYEGSTSKLRLYTTAGTAAIDVFTVSAAQPGYPQIRVGRDAAQWVGFYTTDRDGYIVTRQDETDAGTNTLNFDIWDSGTGIHTWNWNSANGSGASSVNRMSLNKTGNLTVTGTIDSGAITAPTFLGDSNGTINTVTTAVTKANATNDATVATTAFVQNLIGTIPAGLVFQGTWDARTQAEGGAAGDRGNPALADGVGTTGNFYIVSNSGSVNLDGVTDWVTGDWAVFIEQGATDAWEKIDNSSVLDGAGTGDKIAKWDGSGTSNTLTNSLITDDGTNISLLDNTAASGQNPISYIYGHDSGTATAKYGKMQIDTNGNFHITAEDQYLYLNAANYIQSSKVHIMNEDVFMYKGKHIRFLDGPGDSWNDVLGLTASTDIIQIGAIASFNSGVGEVAFYAANAEKMRLDVSGNLGIGNEEPLDKLDVTGVVNSSKNIVSNAVYTTFTARSNRTVNDYGGLNKNYLKLDLVTPGAATTGEASQHAYADLRIQLANNAASTAMADIMTLRYNGNVGIGNTVPYSKLQVGDPESTTQTMLTIASRYNNTAPPALNFRSGHPSNANVWNMVQIRGDDDGNYNGRMEFLTTTVGGNSTGVPDIKMVLKANGNVGIATTAPTRKLQVEGSFYARGAEIGYNDLILKEVSSSPYSPELKFQNNTHILGIDYQNNETLRFITRSGATTVPITFQMRAGTITAVNFVLSSDERLKENIKELEPKKIEANWKSFNAKNNKESYRTGVIAQELEVKHPEFVETNDEGFKSVKYIDLLISKIAELEDRIKNLEK